MADVLVCDNESHPMSVEEFDASLAGYGVDHVELPSGSLDVTIDTGRYDLSGYRALYIRVGEVTADVLDAAPDLELVATVGSGYDHVDVDAATERGVVVTHTPEAPAPGVVEHTFGLIVSLLHELPELFSATAAGEWSRARRSVAELHGRTVGVVGLGTVGARVAFAASRTFDADVLGYDPYVTGEAESEVYPRVDREEVEAAGVELVGRDALFRRADLVTLHVPLTERTRGSVGRAELSAIEDGYLVNTSRGAVVDEPALIEAVEDGALAGVALDVMATEPPDPDNPLLGAENVYVTPHVAGGTEGFSERSARRNAERIRETLEGGRPDGLLNPGVLDR
jgi:D-3-phosphoglycerate dehydrogenase